MIPVLFAALVLLSFPSHACKMESREGQMSSFAQCLSERNDK